ncbi:MAG: DUF115 domain-containing protein [Treponema sp.]|nr:DUF115 domain-containing protein [Treponema sp.]
MAVKIEFIQNARGIKTCSADGIKLHSAYNPEVEAERFVQSIECPFFPEYILVTGPALSYCLPYLKKRFPQAKICAVRYCHDFDSDNNKFSKVFYSEDKNLCESLFNFMGEEGLAAALFLSWQPSEKAFPDEYKSSWGEIKKAVLKSRDVLATREYFSQRWVKNCLRFCLFANETAFVKEGTSPILICASGPSLKTSLPKIKELRESFFLIAVSSALSPLLEFGIKPDLCISTDGGYWAKRHLSFCGGSIKIPTAISAESAIYAKQMEETPVIPLSYGGGICQTFLERFSFKSLRAKRNGSVSGTAAELALSLTSSSVFFCGLDLAPSKGFSHTQPNNLEKDGSLKDTRMRTKESRLTPSSFDSPALCIYRDWFASQDFGGRLYRLSAGYPYSNSLGKIRDVDWNFFEDFAKKIRGHSLLPQISVSKFEMKKEDRLTLIEEILTKESHSPEWIKEALPSLYITASRSGKDFMSQEIEEKMDKFIENVKRAALPGGKKQ